MKSLLRLSLFLVSAVLSAAPVPDGLAAEVRARYSRMTTVHLRAAGAVSLTSPGGATKSSVVRYEYFASGNRYRVRSISEPVIDALSRDIEVAYDGDEWQGFLPFSSELDVSRSEARKLPIPHPNPLFLPVAFLSPKNPGHMSLADLADAVPGDASYEVTAAEIGGARVPARIRHFAGGVEDLEIVSDNFVKRDPVGPVPLHVVVTGFGPDGTSLLRLDYTIELLEIGKPLPPGVFRIDPSIARTVYDADTGVVLKSPDTRLQGKTLEGAQQELNKPR